MQSTIQYGIFRTSVVSRHARGARMRLFYFSSLILAFLALLALLFNIANRSFGLVAVDFAVNPAELSEEPLEELGTQELADIIAERQPGLLLRFVHEYLSPLPELADMQGVPLRESLRGSQIPSIRSDEAQSLADTPIEDVSADERAQLLGANLSQEDLLNIIEQNIIQEDVLEAWDLNESIFQRGDIERRVVDHHELDPETNLKWRSWISWDFITSSLSSSDPSTTGIRPALFGTIWIMLFVILIAFPLGVGGAIYLEEYATDNLLNRLIAANIRNLAAVPSIIYGMLGLAIFVRALVELTSGQTFGNEQASENGRTIISASMTLALLILPIIIIQTQEALRAVPMPIREGSYGLGATRWQTIWRQVLPYAFPSIMTGTIIALSRAIGETAPLIVVGAATFISTDPSGPFSKFTALPILIFNWTTQPQPQFQNAASAAIIVLLLLLLTMNSIATVLRSRTARRSS